MGCLALAAIIVLPLLFAGGYASWYYLRGFRQDPALLQVMARVREDPIARGVLGEDIRLESLEGESLSTMIGVGRRNAYLVRVRGRKSEGMLMAAIEAGEGGRVRIGALTLTGPHGEVYNLVSGTGPPTPTNSI